MDFEKIYKMNEWTEGEPHYDSKIVIKNSFIKDKDWWEENVKVANAVSQLLFNFNQFVDPDDDDLAEII